MKRAPRNKEMNEGVVKFVGIQAHNVCGTQTLAAHNVCEDTNIGGGVKFVKTQTWAVNMVLKIDFP